VVPFAPLVASFSGSVPDWVPVEPEVPEAVELPDPLAAPGPLCVPDPLCAPSCELVPDPEGADIVELSPVMLEPAAPALLLSVSDAGSGAAIVPLSDGTASLSLWLVPLSGELLHAARRANAGRLRIERRFMSLLRCLGV
jgi:hypothetical protein